MVDGYNHRDHNSYLWENMSTTGGNMSTNMSSEVTMETIDQNRLNKAYLRLAEEIRRIKNETTKKKPPQVKKPEEAPTQLQLF